jgi:hypothetical protein
VSFGSLADILISPRHVRFTPNNGRSGDLGWDDHLPDWPERETSKFHMRPREWDPDNGYGQHDGGDEVTERQPPTCENKP